MSIHGTVTPLRGVKSLQKDHFQPPKLPVLLELRKIHGLAPEEAANVLHVSLETLESEESQPCPDKLSNLTAVMMSYTYYLTLYANTRERNILSSHITLRYARHHVFKLSYAYMGHLYGGYTARQWYLFEIHELLLPRDLLEEVRFDLRRKLP